MTKVSVSMITLEIDAFFLVDGYDEVLKNILIKS